MSLGQSDVEDALRACGVEAGDAVFLQAAMSAFGAFEDGPATVVDALEAAVGPRGTIAMPSYPLDAPAIAYLASDPVFDVRSTPSRMGAISEELRKRPSALRSLHPTHPTSVKGPGAREIVGGHETAATPFGEGTPFPRLVERDALQLFFGCGTGAMTMYHAFECTRRPAFPLDVFDPDHVFDARCIDESGAERRVRTLIHNPALHPGRIDSNPRLQAVFRDAILERGGRDVRLGHAEIIAIRLQDLFAVFERLLRDGVTIYTRPLPEPPPTVPLQDRVRA